MGFVVWCEQYSYKTDILIYKKKSADFPDSKTNDLQTLLTRVSLSYSLGYLTNIDK